MSFSISGFPTPQDNNTTRRQSRQQKLQGFFTGGKPIKTPEIRSIHDNNNGLTRVAGGVTKHNNEFGIFRDAQGNSIARIDYQNNDAPNIFDEEEVRSKDGKLKSRTSRSYTGDGMSYYQKYEYDENENLKNKVNELNKENFKLKNVLNSFKPLICGFYIKKEEETNFML